MEKFQTSDIPKSPRIQKLVDALYEHMPVIESARAKLITESYKETEGEPIITRRAKAFAHILHNIPIIIRDNELIVGSSTIAPRGCQTFPEFSYEWLEAELDTVATRTAAKQSSETFYCFCLLQGKPVHSDEKNNKVTYVIRSSIRPRSIDVLSSE